jgi:hypothetical protein
VINWPAAGGGTATWIGALDDDWANPGNWQGGSVPAAGADVIIPAGAPNYPLLVTSEIVGDMTVDPGASVGFIDGTLEVQGDLTGGGDMLGGGPTMSGAGVTLAMGSLGDLRVTGNVTMAADLFMSGSLAIDGIPAHLNINGRSLDVVGDLALTNSGTIQMTVAGSDLTVNGSATFDGGPLTGLMTQGTFTLRGNLTQLHSSTPSSFRTGPSFTTIMAGSTPQAITMADSLLSHFSNLSNTGSAGLVANSLILVQSDLTLGNNVQVTATDQTTQGGGFDVRGNVTTGAGSNLQVGRLYLVGNLTVNGTWSTTSVIFQGATQTAPVLPYQQVFTQVGNISFATGAVSMSQLSVGSGTLNLGGRTTVSGGVFVTGGNLKPNNHTLAMGAALNVSGTGTLTMQSPLDSVITGPTGAAIFGGGSTLGLLTDGVLKVGGSFSQTSGTSSTSFAASGTHKTVLGAAGVRVVNFATPGTGGAGSHFGNLDVTAGTGDINLVNNIVVDGSLISAPTGLTPKLVGGGKSVTAMSLSISTPLTTSLIFDNAPLIVNEQGTIRSQLFDKAQFSGFPTSATSVVLIDMALVGAPGPRGITFNTTTVQPTLGTGGLYARLLNSNGPVPVTVTFNGSNDPTGGPSRSNPSFQTTFNGATILWQ